MNISHSASRNAQSGAVLVVALILLLVMTVLGVSSIGTTSLEERMAANSQERSRALQAADSGLAFAMRTVDTKNITDFQTAGSPLLNIVEGNQNAGAYYLARYVGTNTPPVSAGNVDAFGVGSVGAYYFDVQSIGGNSFTAVGTVGAANSSTVVVNGGLYQIGKKDE